MKTILLTAALGLTCMSQVFAQKTLSDIAHSAKVGGYLTTRYVNSEDASKNTGFDLRYMRAYLNGTMFDDFKYKVQIEVSGAPGVDKGVRLLDAYLDWAKYEEFQVRIGQMKRAFTFENPYNPWDVGFGGNAQCISKLAGMSDRVGEHSSGGRDAGVMIQGDLFPINDLRFLHYQLGFYNGQGINHSEDKNAVDNANRHKDLIGGLWVNPIKNLSIGAFGWAGKYYNSAQGKTYDRNRLAYGFKYESDWTFRGEYVGSEGEAPNMGNKADGWYLAVGAPVCDKLKVYGKWDVYREEKTHATQTTQWCLSGEYWAWKNLKFQLNYYFTEKGQDLSGDHHFNTAELQCYVRF